MLSICVCRTLAAICSICLLVVLLSCNAALSLGTFCGIAGFLLALLICARKAKCKHFPVLLFFLTFAMFLIVICVIRSPQVSDFSVLVDAARQFLAGDKEAMHSTYFNEWPHLWAAGAINTVLFSIVDSVTFIKVCEAAISSGICVFVYLILREITTAEFARFGSVALAFFPLFTFSVEMVNNQVFSAFFCMAALYLFSSQIAGRRLLSKKRGGDVRRTVIASCLMGLFLACAEFIRPDAVLVVISIVLSLVLISLFYKRGDLPWPKRVVPGVISMVSTVSVYIIVASLLSLSLSVTGIADSAQHPENATINKVLMGTNIETAGGWSYDYQEINLTRAQQEETSYIEAGWNTFFERLSNFGYMAELELRKVQNLWWSNSETFNLNQASDMVLNWVYMVEKSWVLLLVIASLVFFLRLFRKKYDDKTINCMLPFIFILFLSFCAYFFIEVQPRYLYFVYIVLFIIGTASLKKRKLCEF